MELRSIASRAECAYCGAHARPNAMYCMNCGQIVVAPRVAPAPPVMRAAPAHAGGGSAPGGSAPGGSVTAVSPHAGQAAPGGYPAPPAPPFSARPGMEQYLLPPVPALPTLAGPDVAVAPAEPPATPPLVAPPLPRLASADTRLVELAFASGERVKIDGTAVLGRRPETTARNSGAQAVVVPDDTMSVSRAHAVIEVQGEVAIVSDAGSANGSAVERDGSTLPLRSGRQIVLEHGDRIWLGNVPIDVSIGVAGAAADREGAR